MLNSIELKNFKNLDGLVIQKLSRVNLIVGKNNCGKTNLLEAVELFVKRMHSTDVIQLFERRGGGIPDEIGGLSEKCNEDSTTKAIAALFTSRTANSEERLEINVVTAAGEESVHAFLVLAVDDDIKRIKDAIDRIQKNRVSVSGKEKIDLEELFSQLRGIKGGEVLKEGRIEEDSLFGNQVFCVNAERSGKQRLQFVQTSDIGNRYNALLWDNALFRGKEDEVIKGLNILDPTVKKLHFLGGSQGEIRMPYVRRSTENEMTPLASMGDGMSRILNIILAMLNAEKGYLLIDEFENGLHYSVQEKLWEIIFKLSAELDVQVFATTHSKDCIGTFAAVLDESKGAYDGRMIRLKIVKGKVKAVEYSEDELVYTTEHDIEAR